MKKYSWWTYDDEYISGWQYFGRFFCGFLLCLILVGFYLLSVTAYKRAKSLGHQSTACSAWGVWGVLVPFLAFTPIAVVTNTIPHWYLWFSSGNGPKKFIDENSLQHNDIVDVDFEKDYSENLRN
tara:strand:+ start:279 stop:653 length:375 start_codon:yes stop_codon:yes gene_type:complete